MLDMEKYSEKELTLHHYPPFHITKHTVFDESFLLTRQNHDYIEYLARTDKKEYQKIMEEIKGNKQLLLEKRSI